MAAEFLIDAWPDRRVTLSYKGTERFLVFTFTADEATKVGMLLVDRARIARLGEFPADEEEDEEDATD